MGGCQHPKETGGHVISLATWVKIVVQTGRLTIRCLIVVVLTVRVASAQGTTTFLSNIGQPPAGSLAVGSDSWIAGAFGVGTDASGYLLDSVKLGMASSTGSPSDFTVMLYANRSPAGINPGNSLGTFIGSLNPSTSGTYTYTATSGLMLSARGTYFIVVTAETPVTDGSYEWNYANAVNYNSVDGWQGGLYLEPIS